MKLLLLCLSPAVLALSLGWGIHAPLAFLTARPRLDEPFWQFSEQSRRAWRRRGSAQDVYLFYAEPYDHFGYGGQFLRAIRALDPARVELRSYADREGAPVLLAARILADHDLAWRGDFRIRLRGGAPGARVR